MGVLNKISKTLEKIMDYYMIIALIAMSIIYFSSVFARFVLNSGIPWAEEFTRYTNVSLVLFGTSYAARYRQHINVSALESAIQDSTKQKMLYVLQQVATCAFFIITAFVGFKFASTAVHVSPTLRIPMKFIYTMVSTACLLVGFQTIVYILNVLTGKEVAK